jgi:pilus assembly protein CpaE
MRTILIAEADGPGRKRLAEAGQLAGGELVFADTIESAGKAAQLTGVEVLVVGPSLACDAALELAEGLQRSQGIATVVVAATVDSGLLRRAMRAGVTDVAGIYDTTQEVASAIVRAGQLAARLRVPVVPEIEPGHPGKVVTVFSTKGGVGKTVISTNLGVALASMGHKVALVDLDLEFGDVGIMLGLKPEHTINDAVAAFDRLDGEMLAGIMEHHSSGLHTLLAPPLPEDADAIPTARIGQILDLVRENYDYVVIDTCPAFSEPVLAALDRSDALYVITTMDVASIKNTRISLQKLHQLGYNSGRVRLVLNRSDSKVLLQPVEVEQAIGGKIFAYIPSDRIVPRSVNQGIPIVLEMPRSEVAKSILRLAKDAEVPVKKESGHVA